MCKERRWLDEMSAVYDQSTIVAIYDHILNIRLAVSEARTSLAANAGELTAVYLKHFLMTRVKR